ncbi:FG-GAP repeat protein [Streptomyces cadmiisoli]|uniref:FG-GAP repeat protein n=1 Tax=Streptomyces cadmiisoli TaxID=2184053 RepID=UPI00365427E6
MRKRSFLLTTGLLASGLTPLALASPATAATAKFVDDFNGDGHRDVVFGDGTATVGGKKQAGAVVVVWGTARGPAVAVKRSLITQNTPYIAGTAETNDFFGTKVTAADMSKGGYGDLGVGVPRSGKGGAVHILKGTSAGPSTTVTLINQATTGVPGTPESADYFGYDVSAADMNGDGCPDLAAGVPGQVLGESLCYGGVATLLRGSKSGLTGKNSRQYDVRTPGVDGDPAQANTSSHRR